MKTLLMINLTDGNEAALKTVGGRTVLSKVLDYAAALVPKEDVLLLLKEALPGNGLKSVLRESWNEAGLLAAMKNASAGYDTIVYVYGDAPFLDSGLTRKMIENHGACFAEYSFADGYPYGLTPEILKTRILPALETLLKDGSNPVRRDTLFSLIQRDINAFDLETELSKEDLRLLRVSLTTETKRNHLLMERLASEGPKNADDIVAVLRDKPEYLRTLPAYLQIQITDGCPQACSYCPYPKFGKSILERRGFMESDRFDRIAEEAEALCGDAVIGVSLWGEPSFHPEFARLCESVKKRPGLRLLVETSGLGWKDEVLAEAKDLLGGRAVWIVSFDGTDEASYEKLRGKGYAEALERAGRILELFPATAYIQAVRTKENEDALETFYRTWKEKTSNVIIQKYDWFSGFLEQKKVTDLSPLKRFPCWHLKRDMVILMDGTVPLCREDLENRHVLGDVFTDGLSALWEKGRSFYEDHLKGNYPELCGKCDEYYTYNF